MEYLAKLKDKLSFEVLHNDRLMGTITYQKWFKFNATVLLDDHSTYQIDPKGFWGTTVELKHNEIVLIKFKMNWSGEIVVQTFFGGHEKGFMLSHKGIFKESFVLVDEAQTELLTIKPDLKWRMMSYEYLISTSDNFEKYQHRKILLLAAIHCANYYMSMSSGE